MSIRAVIFDHDGTLVDSYEGIAECMRLTCRDLGKPEMSEPEILASIGPTLENRFTELWGEEAAERGVRIYRAHYEKHFLSGTRVLPGVLDTLEQIAAKRIPMACVTNKTYTYAVQQLEHFHLLERMSVVYGNRQGLPPKPDPAMVHAAIGKLGITPEEAVLVGDTPIDVTAARAAKVQSWVVLGSYASLDSIRRAGPDKIFHRFSEILKFL